MCPQGIVGIYSETLGMFGRRLGTLGGSSVDSFVFCLGPIGWALLGDAMRNLHPQALAHPSGLHR